MDKVIEERIDTVNNHRTPSGYCRTKDIGLAPIDWTLGKISDVIKPIKRAVPKPGEPYWRLGIKSWAKGTFHAYVNEPETVDMDELYVVHENDLVVNITFAWEHAIAIACKDDQGLLVSHRFPTYEFKNGQIPDFYKSVISQKLFKDLLEHISPGGAGRNRVLNQKDFLNLPCYIPPLSEQQKISEILDHFDKLINLGQAKVDEYKSLKKTCLSKMFPQDGSDVPELRFPGFTDSWEQRKLGEVANSFEYGLNAAAKEYDGKNKYLRITDIDDESHQFKTDDLTSPDADLSKADTYKLQKGDVLFARTGASVGKSFIYKESDGLVYFAGFLIRAKVKPEYDSEFVFQNTLCKDYEKYIQITSQRSGQPGVNAQEYAEYSFYVPEYSEQKQIGIFFRNLDNLITLHQREVEEYTRLKKAMMQLLLTGLVRVKI